MEFLHITPCIRRKALRFSALRGLSNWEQTEITAGLNEGDQIVMSLDRVGVKAGVRVQPEVGTAVK